MRSAASHALWQQMSRCNNATHLHKNKYFGVYLFFQPFFLCRFFLYALVSLAPSRLSRSLPLSPRFDVSGSLCWEEWKWCECIAGTEQPRRSLRWQSLLFSCLFTSPVSTLTAFITLNIIILWKSMEEKTDEIGILYRNNTEVKESQWNDRNIKKKES